MLRPATPLTILFLLAFAFLVISTISTPLVKSIPLATYDGVDFGVLGWCNSKDDRCSEPHIQYNTNVFPGDSDGEFTLPSKTRHSLSSILVVHPIAALLTLICAILAGASHLHSPAHSPRYLLFLLILSFPTLLVTLLAFLVDILLFVPHLRWGGWIVLAATIIICCCSVLTCAMRRTLVSRKARKKRIAENSEMNGTNTFQAPPSQPPPQYTRDSAYVRADSPPPLNGAAKEPTKPAFTAFDSEKPRTENEDQVPLNPSRDPSIKTTSSRGTRDPGGNRHRSPSAPGSERSQRSRGGPMPPRGRGPPPGRGRGGYPPRGGWGPPRGGYPARGGPGMRGGYPPPGGYLGPPRGGPSPGGYGDRGMGPAMAGAGAGMAGGAMMSRGYGGPPHDPYGDDYYNRPGARDNYGQPPMRPAMHNSYSDYAAANPYGNPQDPYGGAVGYDRGPSPVGHPQQPAQYGGYDHGRTPDASHEGLSFGFNGANQSPTRSASSRPRDPSPTPPVPLITQNYPIGQAVEMDAASGSPARSPAIGSPQGPVSPLDPPVGFGGAVTKGGHSVPSPTSSPAPATGLVNSPLNNTQDMDNAPVELPGSSGYHQNGQTGTALEKSTSKKSSEHPRTSGDHYYEDVDPRFAQNEPLPNAKPNHTAFPSALVPGNTHPGQPPSPFSGQMSREESAGSIYSDAIGRTRSPAHSDTSNFTSISQRGVNPDWAPSQRGPPGGGYGDPPPQRPQDSLLAGNPDFAVPGIGAPGAHGRHRRQGSGGAATGRARDINNLAGPYPGM
ncbi:MAG: regulator of ime2 [Alyxoria varia]|nr:MAG: regulator of ime2 [Alyxoria varia]